MWLHLELRPSRQLQNRTTLWCLWAEAAVHCSAAKSCLTLCDPVDCSTPVSSCFTVSLSLLKHISIESRISSNFLILCRPLVPCPQSLPASGSFPISQLFALGGQIIGASTSVFPLKIRVDFLYFFPFIFISWRLITLQYCSGFCHALTWISHEFTSAPHPDPTSRLPPHPIPLGLPSVPALIEVSWQTTVLIHIHRETTSYENLLW